MGAPLDSLSSMKETFEGKTEAEKDKLCKVWYHLYFRIKALILVTETS